MQPTLVGSVGGPVNGTGRKEHVLRSVQVHRQIYGPPPQTTPLYISSVHCTNFFSPFSPAINTCSCEVLEGRTAKLDSRGRSRWKAWLGSMCLNRPSSLNSAPRARKLNTPRMLADRQHKSDAWPSARERTPAVSTLNLGSKALAFRWFVRVFVPTHSRLT